MTPSTDLLFELLADRRRHILHCLTDQPDGVAGFTDLVDAVVGHEPETDAEDRETVRTSLYYVHLPKLTDRGHRLRYAERSRPLQPAAAPRGLPGEHLTRTLRWRLIGSDCCFGRGSASMDSRNVPGEATDDWLTLSSSTGRTVPVSVTTPPLGSHRYRLCAMRRRQAVVIFHPIYSHIC